MALSGHFLYVYSAMGMRKRLGRSGEVETLHTEPRDHWHGRPTTFLLTSGRMAFLTCEGSEIKAHALDTSRGKKIDCGCAYMTYTTGDCCSMEQCTGHT